MAKNILVPVDLADMETTGKILAEAVRQAESSDGELTVMTVVPDMITGLDYRYAIRGETGGSEHYDLKAVVQEALQRLNDIVSDQTPDGMHVDTIARHGTVYEEVLEVAKEIGADQIIVGAHRPSLADFLIGPNTARIVRHATCSVNVIRD